MENIFSSLGIKKEETETYLSLLKYGPIAVGKLSAKVGKPRPSLYGFLKRLQAKGLASQSMRSGVKTFMAEPPQKVQLLFQQQLDGLHKSQLSYRSILPQLESNFGVKFTVPKFQLFEGKDAMKGILRDILIYCDGEYLTFWPPKPMIEILTSEYFEYFQQKRVDRGLHVRALWPIKQKVDAKTYPYLKSDPKYKREIRFAPKEIDFTMGFTIYGNRASFISSKKENFGFIIESQEFVEILRSLFEFFWKISKVRRE